VDPFADSAPSLTLTVPPLADSDGAALAEATGHLDDPWAAEAALQGRDRETHVVVRLGNGRYALALSEVAEVVPLPALTRLPSGPLWMAGISNWRGRVLPVLDLRPLVGAERRPAPGSARMVVIRDQDVEAGLLVEAVHGLIVCEDAFAEVPPTVPPAAASILTGTVERSGGPAEASGPIGVLDVVSVLALRGQLAQARPAW
jgi:purine-binding chemotaxis protein CheW